MAEQNTCANCGEAIGFFDKSVRMVQQVDVTTMNPAGQRQWKDASVSTSMSNARRTPKPAAGDASRRYARAASDQGYPSVQLGRCPDTLL